MAKSLKFDPVVTHPLDDITNRGCTLTGSTSIITSNNNGITATTEETIISTTTANVTQTSTSTTTTSADCEMVTFNNPLFASLSIYVWFC